MEKNDLKNVIAGMAKLGQIYLRIEGKIRTLYAEDQALLFKARELMADAGYIPKHENMSDLVMELISKEGKSPVAFADRMFLKHYAQMFYDPVLTVEVVTEFASKDDEGRAKMKEEMMEQLCIFPDRHLGGMDLVLFGYAGHDLFPVGEAIASELVITKAVPVYGLYKDGRKAVLADLKMVRMHEGMFAVRKEDWMGYYLKAMREGREITFSFREEEKQLRIYQCRDDADKRRDIAFMPYDAAAAMGVRINAGMYDLVYEGQIRKDASLDEIFEIFNIRRPSDFNGHSLSVSDVITVMEGGEWNSYYVDSFGFKKIPDFLIPEKEMERSSTDGKEKKTGPAPPEIQKNMAAGMEPGRSTPKTKHSR